MVDSAYKFQDLFQKLGHKTILVNDTLWIDYQRMVVPVGPVNQNYSLSTGDRKGLLKYFRSCVLVRATTGFTDSSDQWYCVIRDKHIPVDNMVNKDIRCQVRRGLKNCLVRRIDGNTIEKEGWPVFSAAFRRYKNPAVKPTEKQFRQEIINDGFEDIFHYWGVFEKLTGRLIAYAGNCLYGKVEVHYSTAYFHPDFLRLYSSCALFYEMNRYYLEEQKFAYVNDGFRSLLHVTNIQDYLIKMFSFRKQPVGLNIHYHPFVGGCLSFTFPFRHVLGKMYCPLAALYRLEEINRG